MTEAKTPSQPARRFPWFTPAPKPGGVPTPARATADTGLPGVPGEASGGSAAFRQFFDEGFMRRLERLQIVTQRMHGASSQGGRRSKKRGTSVEFADYREYSAGDDLRQIDWNVYGRSERLFVKLREDEESLTVHLLLDCSRSMDWGRHNKLVFGRRLLAALGYVALANQDRVEAAAFNQRLTMHQPPLRARAQVPRLFNFLASVEPAGETDLRVALRSYASMHRRSGLAIVVSDLLNPGGLEGLGALLDRGFEAVLFHVLDPVEMDPELEGEVELYDRESGHALRISIDGATADAYRRRLNDWLAETEAFCAKRMVRYMTVSTAMPLDELVFRQLRARRIIA